MSEIMENEVIEAENGAATETEVQETANETQEGTIGSEERALREHFDRLNAEADELKGLFPGFDLRKELENEAFFRYTAPGVGLSVKQAYMALHGDEILGAAMRYATERAEARTAASVRAGMARPREGGLAGSGGDVQFDVRSMSKQERAELRARVARGERVCF